jgi:formylmethanofuran dehydrogenase subunit E
MARAETDATHLPPDFMDAAAFHGHICPGLCIGYRAAKAALALLKADRARDEELIAIVENDACGADAVQHVTGCTFGKGNLFFLDHGKQVFTFALRGGERAVRVSLRAKADEKRRRRRRDPMRRALEILNAPTRELFKVSKVKLGLPPTAKIRESQLCGRCGEPVMVTRLQVVRGKRVCIPCAEKLGREGAHKTSEKS